MSNYDEKVTSFDLFDIMQEYLKDSSIEMHMHEFT